MMKTGATVQPGLRQVLCFSRLIFDCEAAAEHKATEEMSVCVRACVSGDDVAVVTL